MNLREKAVGLIERLEPRRRQYLVLGLVCLACIGVLYVVIWIGTPAPTEGEPKVKRGPNRDRPTQVMVPGRLAPVDEWVGTAGRKLEQYELERQAQARTNAESKAFEAAVLQRFAELEKRQAESAQKAQAVAPSGPQETTPRVQQAHPPAPAAGQRDAGAPRSLEMPPGIPPGPRGPQPGAGGAFALPIPSQPALPALTRITMPAPAAPPKTAPGKGEPAGTYLPVGFVRSTLLGGVDAPTGGQAQSNPLPVLFQLSDNAVLPNRYRAQVRECMVIGSAYGDISSERVYIRTVNLSCVRLDGTTVEVPIQGNVYGEDGKLGLRGRLVTKQGQLLANALRAGVVSGIAEGFSRSGSSVTSTPIGDVVRQGGSAVQNFQRGLGEGAGRALDNLANYYIKMAEQTFPVLEIDDGRAADIVFTKGTRIDLDPISADGEGRRRDIDERASYADE